MDLARTIPSFVAPRERPDRGELVRAAAAVALLVAGALGAVGLILDLSGAMALVGVAALLALPVRTIQAWALPIVVLAPADEPTERPEAAS